MFAETVDVILPSVFDAVVFEANQFHDANVPLFKFVALSEPTVKPSLSNEATCVASVPSALVALETKNSVSYTHLTLPTKRIV